MGSLDGRLRFARWLGVQNLRFVNWLGTKYLRFISWHGTEYLRFVSWLGESLRIMTWHRRKNSMRFLICTTCVRIFFVFQSHLIYSILFNVEERLKMHYFAHSLHTYYNIRFCFFIAYLPCREANTFFAAHIQDTCTCSFDMYFFLMQVFKYKSVNYTAFPTLPNT